MAFFANHKSMKNKTTQYSAKVLFFLIFLLSATVFAFATQLLYQSSGVSRFKLYRSTPEGSRTAVHTSQNYDLYRHFSEEGGDQLFLLSSSKTTTQYLDAEGMTGTTSWTVRTGTRLERVLWSRTEPVTELNLHGTYPLVVSGKGGCCGELTGYRLFHIETGRLLMSFNDFSYNERVIQPFSLETPNSNLSIRYIGGLSQDSTRDRDFVTPVAGMQATLLLKYADTFLRQKIQIDMNVASGYAPSVLEFKIEKDPSVPGSDEIEIRDDQVQLWNIDGVEDSNQIRGVLLKVVLNAGFGDRIVKIPVRNDRLHLGSAVIPAGVSIRSIPL